MQSNDQQEGKKFSWKSFLSLGEVGEYFFRKKDPTRPVNVNIRVMHGINKFSIVIFLLAIVYFLAKRFLF